MNGVTTDFYLNGSDIVIQISGTDRLDFAYDEAGNLYGFFYQNSRYLYVRNGQGGYYDAGTARFINADEYISTGQGMLGNNMFAYCLNNPVNKIDETGTFAIPFIIGVVVLLVTVVTSVIIVQHNYTASKRLGNTYDPQYEGLYDFEDFIETTETIITVEVAVITYIIESVSNNEEKAETNNNEKKGETNQGREEAGEKLKNPKKGTGKEKADDVPSWAKGNRPYEDENGKKFAKRLCDDHYGKGNYDTKGQSDYSKIRKWGDRGFE